MRRRARRFASQCRRCFGDAEGAVMVELAIVTPLLVLLILGVSDYGALMGQAAALGSATRAGAEVAKSQPGVTGTGLTSLGLFPSGSSPTLTNVCTCANGNWPAGATCPPGPFDTPCAGIVNPFTGKTDQRALEYVRVSRTQSSTSFSAWSGLPASVTEQAFTRTQ